MKRLDYISSFVLVILAVVLFFQARGLPFWGELGPAEGFFPHVLSVLLGGLSILILVRALAITERKEERPGILGPKRWKFFAYLVSFFAFGLLFGKVGYSVTLAAFLVFILRFVEKQSWKMTIAVAALSLFGSHLIFVRFLKVSIPEGWLTSLIGLMN